MRYLDFNMPVAVAVGFVALARVAAETLVVVLIYLEQAMAELKAERVAESRLFCRAGLQRPKMVTAVAIMAGLVPILWSTGTGSEVMRRIAMPMIGGMVSSTVLTQIVIPAVYRLIKGWRLPEPVAVAHSPSEGAAVALKATAEVTRSRNQNADGSLIPGGNDGLLLAAIPALSPGGTAAYLPMTGTIGLDLAARARISRKRTAP